MKNSWTLLLVAVPVATLSAQPALQEPPEYPSQVPGPVAGYVGTGCFHLASGNIVSGDVDWVQVSIPWASTQTLIDVDFPAGSGASVLLATVVGGNSGFNIADNNNIRDAYCGLSATSNPVGSVSDSAVNLSATPRNAVINIGISGAEDTGFRGSHTRNFAYNLWVYVVPIPCDDNGDCNDNVACTVDTCNTGTGICTNAPNHSACDSGLFCAGEELCDARLGCRPGLLPDCDDGVDCTDDYCDTDLDACAHDPYDDFCDDGSFCNGFEFCDLQNDCQAGTPPDCDDGVACTTDACHEDGDEGWCINVPNHSFCTNGLSCDGTEYCDATDDCQPGVGVVCDDGIDCTVDSCDDANGGCLHVPDDDACDNGVYCDGVETCDPSVGCLSGAVVVCDDDVPCTVDSCDEGTVACRHAPDDAVCDNGLSCDGDETCDPEQGCQAGSPMDCDDGIECTVDACNESESGCVHTNDDSACDNGLFCDGVEVCDSEFGCVRGVPPCEDGESCDEANESCGQFGPSMDIRPGVCPNRLNRNGGGSFKVALVGTATFDVRQVRRSSVRLSRADGAAASLPAEGAEASSRAMVLDVATPMYGEGCECHDLAGDGVVDLVFRFDHEQVMEQLRLRAVQGPVQLQMTGTLRNGTTFAVTDCVVLPPLPRKR